MNSAKSAEEEVRGLLYKAIHTGIKAGLTAIQIRQIIDQVMANYNL